MPGGYLVEYLLKTNIPGASSDNAFEGTVYNWHPPMFQTRWRDVPANGRFVGYRTRLGMQLEAARMGSFITQERYMELDASQWAGADAITSIDQNFEFFGVLVQSGNGDVYGEYCNVTAYIADVTAQDVPAEGGQEHTYALYVAQWSKFDVPAGVNPQQGWLVEYHDYRSQEHFKRRLNVAAAGMGQNARNYAGSAGERPWTNPDSFRNLREHRNQLLGR